MDANELTEKLTLPVSVALAHQAGCLIPGQTVETPYRCAGRLIERPTRSSSDPYE